MMMNDIEVYRPREIVFHDLVRVEDWNVKVYTITNRAVFQAEQVLKHSINSLHQWLQEPTASELPVYNMAFMIVHEAREGVWILLNWWTGGEMLETVTYFAYFDVPDILTNSPHDGALICVWDLEIVVHERKAWIEHILKQADDPDVKGYLNSHLKQL